MTHTMEPRTITADTRVVVTLKGQTGLYTLAGPSRIAALSSWVNTLSDLTGYTADWLLTQLTRELSANYGATLTTAAGDLCPIRFAVTLASITAPAPETQD